MRQLDARQEVGSHLAGVFAKWRDIGAGEGSIQGTWVSCQGIALLCSLFLAYRRMDSKKRNGNGSCAQVRGQHCEPVACDGNMEGERINWKDLSCRAVAVGGVPIEKTLY